MHGFLNESAVPINAQRLVRFVIILYLCILKHDNYGNSNKTSTDFDR